MQFFSRTPRPSLSRAIRTWRRAKYRARPDYGDKRSANLAEVHFDLAQEIVSRLEETVSVPDYRVRAGRRLTILFSS